MAVKGMRILTNGVPRIPYIKECVDYIESCGYKFSHYSLTRTYVFYRISDNHEVFFNLKEIREAKRYGW